MDIGDFLGRIFKANTVEGTRESMQQAYQNSLRKSRKEGGVPISQQDVPEGATGPPEHTYALFEMLASRYSASGVSRDRIEERSMSIWVELSPFLYLDREVGMEALAEYVVWKEATEEFPGTLPDVHLDWLQEKVCEGVRRAEEADPSGWVVGARQSAEDFKQGDSVWIRWVEFL